MLYIRGSFVNTDGIEHQSQFFDLEKNKQIDFLQAAKIAKKNFLVICSDRHGFIRIASVEPVTYHHLSTKGKTILAGHFFNSLRNHAGLPMTTYDLVKRLPEMVINEEIIKIAQLHLAGNKGEKIEVKRYNRKHDF